MPAFIKMQDIDGECTEIGQADGVDDIIVGTGASGGHVKALNAVDSLIFDTGTGGGAAGDSLPTDQFSLNFGKIEYDTATDDVWVDGTIITAENYDSGGWGMAQYQYDFPG